MIPSDVTRASGQLTLEVVVNGRPVREYSHQGETFIEGRRGSEYTLRVRNRSNRRAVAILSVDGLSIMTGKPASSTGGGYIVDAYGTIEIPGWRLNNAAVAAFMFGGLPEAYATQMGQPDNIGVIGMITYLEKKPIISNVELDMLMAPLSSGALSFGPQVKSRGMSPQSFGGQSKGIGTAFGREREHRVNTVEFEEDNLTKQQMCIRYDTAEGLQERGIVLYGSHQNPDRVANANPFPGDTGCQPPPGWKGVHA